ncbi:MAG: hypothetical protein HY000_21620 [Planctomycetes bacterium]|nr:hypothetical protein [Planctomycetota bacterium]
MHDKESRACEPIPIQADGFNPGAVIPYGLKADHIKKAMTDFIDFLGFINTQLHTKRMQRLESFLMPANFSSMVGEFMSAAIPKYCRTIVRNRYHNGHPDLVPKGHYPADSVLHGPEGIEVKASRHPSGWQGHNPEDVWLLVFVFDANSSRDESQGIEPKPFRFLRVVRAQLEKDDWQFSGRSSTSRRTITASVKRSGFEKMEANWIYRTSE